MPEPARKRRRPWRVHVRDIGPNFSFGNSGAARWFARALTREYAAVDIYSVDSEGLERWTYRSPDAPPTREVMVDGTGWKVVPLDDETARRWVP